MSTIQKISCQETFNTLTTFQNVKELNEAVRQHIQQHKHCLNKNAVRILRYLKDYSKKYKGVSYRNKANIASDLGLSKRTIIRNCTLLEKLGIIKQYSMKRNSDFMQTSNAIVIQPFAGEVSENVTPVSPQKELLIKNNINNIKITSKIDHSYLPDYIDSSFIEITKSFFNAEKIYSLWLKVHIAYKKSRIIRPLPQVIGVVNTAFKQTVFLYKQNKIKTSFDGYFYRLVENYLAVERRKELKNKTVIPLYDWI